MGLLRDIFGEVIIPQEVYNELTTGTHPATTLVKSATWVEVRSVSDSRKIPVLQAETTLDLGECAAILLAEELCAEQLLIDERAARLVAEARKLPVIGTVGILLLAKDQGLISSVKEVLDELIAQGKYISQKLYRNALAAAGE